MLRTWSIYFRWLSFPWQHMISGSAVTSQTRWNRYTPHHTTPTTYTTPHYTTPHHTTPHYITEHHTTPHHTSPTSPPDYIFLPWPSDDWQSVEGEPLRPQPSRARGEGGQTDSALAHSLHQGLLEHFWVDCHQGEMWRGRGSYYGVKLSGDVVGQSRSITRA